MFYVENLIMSLGGGMFVKVLPNADTISTPSVVIINIYIVPPLFLQHKSAHEPKPILYLQKYNWQE